MRLGYIARRLGIILALVVLSCSWLMEYYVPNAKAATGLTVTNGAGGQGTNGWTNPANAQGTADDNTYATAAPANNATITGVWNAYNFDSNLPANAKITKVEVLSQFRVNTNLSNATFGLHAIVGGADCPTTAISDASEPTADTNFTADVTSCRTWTRANLLDANFSTRADAVRTGSLLGVTFSLDFISVRVTYDMPDYEQAAYRWYANSNGTDVGAPIAAQDTSTTLYAPRDRVRLRMLAHVSTTTALAGGESFKLQIATKGASCAASTFADVNGSTAFVFHNNSTPADGATLTTNANDPSHSGHTKRSQGYEEANNAATVTNINVDEDGIWDWSLVGNAGAANTTYCFRMVTSAGTAFTTYSVYPEITSSPAGGLSVDIVDGAGSSVGSPSVSFSSLIAPVTCGSTNATFGISSQKVRVKNTTDTPTWTLTIAATSGATAFWTDGGTKTYDFNDTGGSPNGCTDSGDADSRAGLMAIDPSGGTITPRSVCTSTGLSKGSSASYSEGTTDAITLLNTSSSAEGYCYWDFEGVGMTQQIPGGQAPGSYTINLTLTVVAS